MGNEGERDRGRREKDLLRLPRSPRTPFAFFRIFRFIISSLGLSEPLHHPLLHPLSRRMADFCFLGNLLGLLGFALVFCSSAVAVGVGGGGGSIQDLLHEYGLPPGILPSESAVESFSLNRETGLLEVRLASPCFAKYDGLVFFNQTVVGNLSYGSLKGLEGLSQEELFLWLPVKEISLADPSSGVILFDIGVAQKQISLSLFENPPDCSAGEEAQGEGMIRGGWCDNMEDQWQDWGSSFDVNAQSQGSHRTVLALLPCNPRAGPHSTRLSPSVGSRGAVRGPCADLEHVTASLGAMQSEIARHLCNPVLLGALVVAVELGRRK
ncbi:Uncharacterized protein AXF42_Ash003191 [Apostasia shenzhenica]|uniref:Uncharacterized protein n=1 Tax=Apostasia shenzhenica TaxID=1088818 RepID=A0A2I0BFF0_9ASPA|nr:Uncharacterized protein AXF42_Ash003191 [Apostasia shenzhenica]